jgi:hypothetical protein
MLALRWSMILRGAAAIFGLVLGGVTALAHTQSTPQLQPPIKIIGIAKNYKGVPYSAVVNISTVRKNDAGEAVVEGT